ncbi:MAG: hypothetical protein AAGC64_04660 [Bacteroidota bacterium]
MNKVAAFLIFLGLICFYFCGHTQKSYLNYHREVVKCENLIAKRKYKDAIYVFDSLFKRFDFVYLRDIKLATQLCAFEKDSHAGLRFIKSGIINGWALENLLKNDKLSLFHEDPSWENILEEYDSLHRTYLTRLNLELKNEVHEMFKKDQRKAFVALFKVGQKAKRKYSEKKFAPHSEHQLKKLDQILDQYGYPGERLIGNNWWGSVILSHHNSISVNYNSCDTIYAQIKPKLLAALKRGEISPYELAQIEDWRVAVLNAHKLTSYGFLGAIPDDEALETVNKNRADIGLRDIELRNDLIAIEKETGMNLYLPKGWQNGKITIDNK